MKMREFLWEVRKLLEKPEKWIQHRLHNGDGGHCMLGACMEAARKTGYNEDAAMDEFAVQLGFRFAMDVAQFNDRRTRTHEEILACLDLAMHTTPPDKEL
jgi:hypothetical protein